MDSNDMCINEILDKIYVHYFFTSIVFVDYNKIIFFMIIILKLRFIA